jgi:hypothetical protein
MVDRYAQCPQVAALVDGSYRRLPLRQRSSPFGIACEWLAAGDTR